MRWAALALLLMGSGGDTFPGSVSAHGVVSTALASPAAPTVSTLCVSSCGTSYTYVCTFTTAAGETVASAGASVSSGSSLSSANQNTIYCPPSQGANGVNVYQTAPHAYALGAANSIGVLVDNGAVTTAGSPPAMDSSSAISSSFVDAGTVEAAAFACDPAVASCLPAVAYQQIGVLDAGEVDSNAWVSGTYGFPGTGSGISGPGFCVAPLPDGGCLSYVAALQSDAGIYAGSMLLCSRSQSTQGQAPSCLEIEATTSGLYVGGYGYEGVNDFFGNNYCDPSLNNCLIPADTSTIMDFQIGAGTNVAEFRGPTDALPGTWLGGANASLGSFTSNVSTFGQTGAEYLLQNNYGPDAGPNTGMAALSATSTTLGNVSLALIAKGNAGVVIAPPGNTSTAPVIWANGSGGIVSDGGCLFSYYPDTTTGASVCTDSSGDALVGSISNVTYINGNASSAAAEFFGSSADYPLIEGGSIALYSSHGSVPTVIASTATDSEVDFPGQSNDYVATLNDSYAANTVTFVDHATPDKVGNVTWQVADGGYFTISDVTAGGIATSSVKAGKAGAEFFHHVSVGGTAPSACGNLAGCWGTGATCSYATGSTDSAGAVIIQTALTTSSCGANGSLFNVPYSTAFGAEPSIVIQFNNDTDGGTVPAIPSALYPFAQPPPGGNTSFNVANGTAFTPNTGTKYWFGYHVIGVNGP